jgi:two-component system, cell cycle sensor histidine kinase and response regulator CckA
MGKKILTVDNDRFMLEFISDLLREQGHDVKAAEDGLSALEILKTYIPDIVFLDLVMPNISGDRLCRIIRRMPDLRNPYIVVLSATVAEEPIRFSELGANACIAKGPIDEMSGRILAAVDDAVRPSSAPVQEPVANLRGTDRRVITRELLSVQRHTETLLNNISEGILELNSEGKVIFANNVALSLFGGSEEKLLGHRFIDLFEESERKVIADVLKDIGAGLPETIDPFRTQVHGDPILVKILPVEDNLTWSMMVVAVPLRKID